MSVKGKPLQEKLNEVIRIETNDIIINMYSSPVTLYVHLSLWCCLRNVF